MKKTIAYKAAFLFIISLWGSLAFAESYSRGYGALDIFDKNTMELRPQWVQIWLMVMTASFALGILFIKRHIEARVLVGGFLATLALNMIAVEYVGLEPLSGLVSVLHLICWSPGLFLLLKYRRVLYDRGPFGLWSGWMTLVIISSFIFDVRDAFIYLPHIL